MKNYMIYSYLLLSMVVVFSACEPNNQVDCDNQEIEIGPQKITLVPVDLNERGACSETLSFTPQVSITQNGANRVITSNCIPAHKVGNFGAGQGSLGPSTIQPINETYNIPFQPTMGASVTPIWNTTVGVQYQLGILLNGVVIAPEAAEPFPHKGLFAADRNLEWNLDAMVINLGLDCNNAHVQPSGRYHCHGAPQLYLQSLNITGNDMVLIGYAADGYPIYYKYGYTDPNDATSGVVELKPGYRLKNGQRPGDGVSAPCGEYNGVYTNDWEHVNGLGDLDECNGRMGVTPEYPNGTYYYVSTETYPFMPRCFKGMPSNDFKNG